MAEARAPAGSQFTEKTLDEVRYLINPTSSYSWTHKGYWFLFLLAAGFVPGNAGLMFGAYYFILEKLAGIEAIQGFLLPIQIVLNFAIIVGFITIFSMFAVWMERKVSGHIHGRLGPMEVGIGHFHGWMQTLADGIKLMAKEDLIPAAADKVLFILAPIIAFTGVLMTFLVIPFHGLAGGIAADLNVGLYFFAAIGAVEAIGVIMAGWASNSKWALFGAMRTATQVVSYELPISLVFLAIVMLAGTLSVHGIVDGQQGWLLDWYVFHNPFTLIAFVVYIVAQLAETKRAPFDLPEAESELVAGYHTEYSSMRFSIFFLAEYAAMYVVAALAVALFLGGWFTGIKPLDEWIYLKDAVDPGLGRKLLAVFLGTAVTTSKAMLIVFVQMWVRWTLPRVRLDHVMYLCLKVLLPFAMVCAFGVALWQAITGGQSMFDLVAGIFS